MNMEIYLLFYSTVIKEILGIKLLTNYQKVLAKCWFFIRITSNAHQILKSLLKSFPTLLAKYSFKITLGDINGKYASNKNPQNGQILSYDVH